MYILVMNKNLKLKHSAGRAFVEQPWTLNLETQRPRPPSTPNSGFFFYSKQGSSSEKCRNVSSESRTSHWQCFVQQNWAQNEVIVHSSALYFNFLPWKYALRCLSSTCYHYRMITKRLTRWEQKSMWECERWPTLETAISASVPHQFTPCLSY